MRQMALHFGFMIWHTHSEWFSNAFFESEEGAWDKYLHLQSCRGNKLLVFFSALGSSAKKYWTNHMAGTMHFAWKYGNLLKFRCRKFSPCMLVPSSRFFSKNTDASYLPLFTVNPTAVRLSSTHLWDHLNFYFMDVSICSINFKSNYLSTTEIFRLPHLAPALTKHEMWLQSHSYSNARFLTSLDFPHILNMWKCFCFMYISVSLNIVNFFFPGTKASSKIVQVGSWMQWAFKRYTNSSFLLEIPQSLLPLSSMYLMKIRLVFLFLFCIFGKFKPNKNE